MILRSVFRLLFHLPKIAFQVAGIFRAINRGKRAFRKGLRDGGLPEELVEDLVREFDPLKGVVLGELFNILLRSRKNDSW